MVPVCPSASLVGQAAEAIAVEHGRCWVSAEDQPVQQCTTVKKVRQVHLVCALGSLTTALVRLSLPSPAGSSTLPASSMTVG